MRRCPACGIEKEESDFYRNTYSCKTCAKARAAVYRDRNRAAGKTANGLEPVYPVLRDPLVHLAMGVIIAAYRDATAKKRSPQVKRDAIRFLKTWDKYDDPLSCGSLLLLCRLNGVTLPNGERMREAVKEITG